MLAVTSFIHVRKDGSLRKVMDKEKLKEGGARDIRQTFKKISCKMPLNLQFPI